MHFGEQVSERWIKEVKMIVKRESAMGDNEGRACILITAWCASSRR